MKRLDNTCTLNFMAIRFAIILLMQAARRQHTAGRHDEISRSPASGHFTALPQRFATRRHTAAGQAGAASLSFDVSFLAKARISTTCRVEQFATPPALHMAAVPA